MTSVHLVFLASGMKRIDMHRTVGGQVGVCLLIHSSQPETTGSAMWNNL